MRTTYKIEMSDGKKLELSDTSAGAAIAAALKRNPGEIVRYCRSGLTDVEAKELRMNGIAPTAMAGFITHDVPDHVAMTHADSIKLRPKKEDATMAMFDEVEIIADSKKAKNNFEHATLFK